MTDQVAKTWTYESLMLRLLMAPAQGYRILLCVDCWNPGTAWTDSFAIEVDHDAKVIRIKGDVG